MRVSPQHIGIGMYQHDVSVKKLETALDDVVSECVSFVGVDLNSCPLHVLRLVFILKLSFHSSILVSDLFKLNIIFVEFLAKLQV